ncbi:SCP-2 sterol transfer family protein [Desulfocicer vacuolatum DSM 3385]|uniref:SCP-2 sterol transfer family protein n=1 Tax=Desulfocicer vacuolatum DSM 3385 TaxID=1121400 RepID=A0A1W2EJ94_9BACT|nr:SCP2 sterol-binding domain-containing protein [Desulfocicer vacuolatum]SMD09777.1 SCP-2 sterol transfer family protein [Desulfocicer vacuolatum DSM 3385]
MAIYKDSEHMYEILGKLWNYVIKETEFGPKLKEYDISYKFIVSDPKGYLLITHDEVVIGDEANRDAVITMELSGETIHNFWLNKVNLPVALATRKIKSKGPIPKVLKILPYLKPVFELYPSYCKDYDLPM